MPYVLHQRYMFESHPPQLAPFSISRWFDGTGDWRKHRLKAGRLARVQTPALRPTRGLSPLAPKSRYVSRTLTALQASLTLTIRPPLGPSITPLSCLALRISDWDWGLSPAADDLYRPRGVLFVSVRCRHLSFDSLMLKSESQ